MPTDDERTPDCSSADCAADAVFRRYDMSAASWRPVCERHARHAHPSLEVQAWLESGYLKPIDVGSPSGSPGAPPDERTAEFRALVDAAMGWADESASEDPAESTEDDRPGSHPGRGG